ncbi:putative oxidoreductase [Mesocricetibacter intestinalis]|uniref:Putative oxidoreductase n=1 Tax=Mesocricetibacter intestinalis TaxID=1521930 RepID=A0A4R6VAQ3_9PAST|nr:DoxX family protein [Mesocricetibacter intestinalis]TDQ56385.1 putative oxidoreductase [Mesocricetibacter intestinalis]
MNRLNGFRPYMLDILRILAAYMFMLHGTAKIWEFPLSMTQGKGAVEFLSLYWVGGVIEIIGGSLLILGLFVRAAAFILSGQMAYAYFFIFISADNVLFPLKNGGELAALYSLLFLYFVFAGAGKFSLDYKLFKHRR